MVDTQTVNVINEVNSLSDSSLKAIWTALGQVYWYPEEERSAGVTMEFWSELIYSEMEKRWLLH